MYRPVYFILIVFAVLQSCQTGTKPQESEETDQNIKVSKAHFGVMPEGDSIAQYTLSNNQDMEVKVITYGGIITHLSVPDKNGKVGDVVLGYDHLEGYLAGTPYFGAIVGRYGNRIAKGAFSLDGNEYTLAVNNGENHLHGGIKGFDKVVWDAEVIESKDGAGVKLHYLSPHMEEGYPGNLDVYVTYILTADNVLEINYRATTDQPTVVNITQHSYFNLSGGSEDKILEHLIQIKSNEILPVDAGLIPTGKPMEVVDTPFDFNQLTRVGQRIDDEHEQMKLGGGYDHCWVLQKSNADALEWVIKAQDPISGRVFELATTEPGVQFYSGNFLDGSLTGKNDVNYVHRSGMCFEPEHYPDSPNQEQFPTTVLRPGEEYISTTLWKFSAVSN